MGRWTATAPEVGSPLDECPSSSSFLRFGLRSAKWLYGNRFRFFLFIEFFDVVLGFQNGVLAFCRLNICFGECHSLFVGSIF